MKEIAVKNLVAFVLKTGDLISERSSKHTPQEGIRLHQKIQRQQEKEIPSYLKEQSITFDYKIEETTYHLRGRMDGLYQDNGQYVVEEIKTSEEKFEDLTEKMKEQYFAQGMCYAYFLAVEKNLATIQVKLSYFQVLEKKLVEEFRTFEKLELQEFFEDLMATYHQWQVFLEAQEQASFASIKDLPFPYPNYRKGQEQMMKVVYKALYARKQLFLEAPTGTGKTLSTLYPSIKFLPENKFKKIFYLTAKTITRTVAVESLEALKAKGLKIKAIVITAKDKICFQEHNDENPYVKGYYDRVNAGLMDVLEHEDIITFEIIQKYAKKHTLCPFEFSLDLSLFCQVIICDYNYVYDPMVYLRRFFDEMTEENWPLLLVDESHNLVSRSKDMYSKTLSLFGTKKAYKIFRQEKVKDPLTNQINRRFKKFIAELEDLRVIYDEKFQVAEDLPLKLIQLAYKLTEDFWEWVASHEVLEKEKLVTWLQDLQGFLKVSEFFNEEFQMVYQQEGQDYVLKIICLDPSEFLQNRHRQSYTSLLFSATLQPMDYYQNRLGKIKPVEMSLSSPFEKSRLQVIVASYIETTYQKRTANLDNIVTALFTMGQSKKGNYFIFCPSYLFMTQIKEAFVEKYGEIFDYIIQEKEMTEEKRETFLARFTKENNQTMLAFVLLGGIFSEGIDLKGDALIGCAIVGVGLPQLNPISDLERDYYNQKGANGFSYAYQLPALNKVQQAVGRVIRTATDYGVVLLLDQRYLTNAYRHFLKADWQVGVAYNHEGLQEGLQQFWQRHQQEE